jgi:alpha-D-ribose 1-methylphosphonate 5-triphosphate synthase subunit PhnH
VGTLTNPHPSATIIMETMHLSNESSLCLSGPGIKTTHSLSVDGSDAWLEARAYVNKEYPLGMDLIFVDEAANIASIPRTTKIAKLEVG